MQQGLVKRKKRDESFLKWNFIVGIFRSSITYLQDCKGSNRKVKSMVARVLHQLYISCSSNMWHATPM